MVKLSSIINPLQLIQNAHLNLKYIQFDDESLKYFLENEKHKPIFKIVYVVLTNQKFTQSQKTLLGKYLINLKCIDLQ